MTAAAVQPQLSPRERRRSARLRIDVKVDFESAHNFYTGFAHNVGDGGLFIATQATLRVGDDVLVRFDLPDLGRAIMAEGTVRWVREVGEPESHGMGIAFGSLVPNDRAAIDRFIASRDPIFYVC